MNNRVFSESNSKQNYAHASDPSKQVIFPWTVSCVVSSYMAGQFDLSPTQLRTEWTFIMSSRFSATDVSMLVSITLEPFRVIDRRISRCSGQFHTFSWLI